MAYEKLNLVKGDIFKAEHVAHMEEGIAQNDEKLVELSEEIGDLKENGTGGGSADAYRQNGAWTTRKPFITFVSDDGSAEDISILEPIFKKYGVPCCVALITDNLNNIDDRLDLQNNHGWEVACHSTSSRLFTDMTLEEAETAMVESKTILEGLGFVIKDVVYPSGGANANIRQIAKKHFRAGYNFNPHPSTHLNTGILESFSILRAPLGSFTYAPENATLEYYKSCVDAAVTNNGWCIFCLHSGNAAFDATQQQHLDDLIAYIQSIGVEIGNLSAGYEIFGNYIECGPTYDTSNVASSDRDMSGLRVANSGEHNLPIQHLYPISHTNADLLTAYPENKISIAETGNFNAGFPINTGGTLITSRFKYFSFQIWFPNNSEQVYKRTWNGSAWAAWRKISAEPASDGQFSKLFQIRETWSDSMQVTITSRLFIRTFAINGGVTATLTKQYFTLSEISTDKENPTVIGTTSDGMEIQMAYQTNGYLQFKYSGTTSYNPAYVEIAYA